MFSVLRILNLYKVLISSFIRKRKIIFLHSKNCEEFKKIEYVFFSFFCKTFSNLANTYKH